MSAGSTLEPRARRARTIGGLLAAALLWGSCLAWAWLGCYAKLPPAPAASPTGSPPLPAWMPPAWGPAFWSGIRLQGGAEPLMARDMDDTMSVVARHPWVEAVERVERDFQGHLTLRLRLRKPVCLLKNGAEMRFADATGRMLPLIIPAAEGGLEILDPQGKSCLPPTVDVSGIAEADGERRAAWIRETVAFVRNWQEHVPLRDRANLKDVAAVIYKMPNGRSICTLKCGAFDIKYGKEFPVEWGVNSDVKNSLEDKDNQQKWRELEDAVLKNRGPMRPINLAFPRPPFF